MGQAHIMAIIFMVNVSPHMLHNLAYRFFHETGGQQIKCNKVCYNAD